MLKAEMEKAQKALAAAQGLDITGDGEVSSEVREAQHTRPRLATGTGHATREVEDNSRSPKVHSNAKPEEEEKGCIYICKLLLTVVVIDQIIYLPSLAQVDSCPRSRERRSMRTAGPV